MVDDVRGYLPGSDADEGPLADLSLAGAALPETLAENALDKVRALQRASETLAAAARPELSAGEIPIDPSALASAVPAGGSSNTDNRTYDIDVEVHSDDPETAGDSVMRKFEREMSSGGL